ncbi:hypothetical protein SDJN02_16350 [Cucurbita argyrosperma subsp. argyrosperma]|nr:hypothetical protein SDJN02_16350 [Cucurbita argyrosperma subsp. argyrosperma]
MDASELDKKLLTKYLMENPHDNLPYVADEEDKDASNERIHSHHHHRRSLKDKDAGNECIYSHYNHHRSLKVKEVINFLLYIDEAGEGYKTAAYTKPYSFFDLRMLIFLPHRGDHESRMNKPLLIDIHIH